MKNSPTNKEILATYGTVKKAGTITGWYLSNDHGKAMGGIYYSREVPDKILCEVERRMWHKVHCLENRGNGFIMRFAGT